MGKGRGRRRNILIYGVWGKICMRGGQKRDGGGEGVKT